MSKTSEQYDEIEEQPATVSETTTVEKVEVKEEPTPEPSNRVLLSTDDAYVHDRMKAQPRRLEDIEVKEKELDGKHRLSLPDELKEYEKKYAFRWLFKHKQAIDYACDVKGWVLCNKLYFKDVPPHVFTVNGSIERGDSILAFIPIEQAKRMRKEPAEESREKVKAHFQQHRDDPAFYKPESGSEQVVMI